MGVAQSTTTTSSSHSTSSSTTMATSSTSLSKSTVTTTSTTSTTSSIHSSSSNAVSTSSTAVTTASITSSTTSVSSTTSTQVATASSLTLSNTMLVFAPDAATGYSGTSGFNGYGIPYQLVVVPSTGITLPTLATNNNQTGNYGGIVILNEVSYDYNGTWASALTTAQWNQLYTYQSQFGVRMVRLNVYPSSDFGVTTAIAGSGCCNSGVEQYMRINDTSKFPTAGLVANANVSSQGLWHYPALVTNSTLATAFATFDPSSDGTFTGTTVAAVINTFSNRQQMVWFTSWATNWSETCTYAQHAYIHWLTRGLFLGRRRIYFNTQIDDVHLTTDLYSPNGTTFRLRTGDLDAHVTWMKNIRARLPSGSNYTVELGHNGNGDIETAVTYQDNNSLSYCSPDTAIEYDDQATTALEFQKVLGTGTNIWPSSPANYTWSLSCAKLDTLATWFTTSANLNSFMHISHTFSHSSLDNSTYSDGYKEIQFNQKWLAQIGISSANYFSKGLIPPAITGLHNGDVIRAWMELGVNAVVGDNTRSVLLSPYSEYWPLISNVSANGYAGLEIMPRWATTIYYNCDTPNCTTAEWIATSGGSGGFTDLLANAKSVNTWHLLALRQDPFMFHQANLRQTDASTYTVGSQSGQMSLLMIWVETILQEMYRLTTWPIVTLKHDDLAAMFMNRMTLDQCVPTLNYQITSGNITGVTVGANGNTCGAPVPVTFPGTATTTASGTTKEQLGSDPLTIWTKLSGSAVSYTLGSPIAVYP